MSLRISRLNSTEYSQTHLLRQTRQIVSTSIGVPCLHSMRTREKPIFWCVNHISQHRCCME